MKVGDLVSYYNCDIAVVLWISAGASRVDARL